MKCFQCKTEINDEFNMKVTAPDGDCFHNICYPNYIKERDKFFDNIHDDNWYKKNYPELNKTIL